MSKVPESTPACEKLESRLFVYGSLGPGCENARILEAIGGTWHRAAVRGVLQRAGWGSALGFPGLILDEKGEDVAGHLFESERLGDHWRRLDEFEGEEYRRVVCTARRSDGRVVKAFVYVLAAGGDERA